MAKTSDKLQKLCKGVRAISPGIEIQFKPAEGLPDHWSIVVAVGGAVLYYTDYGELDASLDQAIARLSSISNRMMKAINAPVSEPPPTEPEK